MILQKLIRCRRPRPAHCSSLIFTVQTPAIRFHCRYLFFTMAITKSSCGCLLLCIVFAAQIQLNSAQEPDEWPCDEFCAPLSNGKMLFPNTENCLRDCAAVDAGTARGIEDCKKDYCTEDDGTPVGDMNLCLKVCIVRSNQPEPDSPVSEAASMNSDSNIFTDTGCYYCMLRYDASPDCIEKCKAFAAGFDPAFEVSDNSTTTTTSPTPASVPAASSSQKMTYGIATVCVAFFMAMAM